MNLGNKDYSTLWKWEGNISNRWQKLKKINILIEDLREKWKGKELKMPFLNNIFLTRILPLWRNPKLSKLNIEFINKLAVGIFSKMI